MHTRETTNIALHRPVKASHTLFVLESGESQQAGALTDGLPATIAHPDEPGLGANFYFEVDLGRVAALDHIGLRNRGDFGIDRFSRVRVRLYENDPSGGAVPAWEGMDRADGSHPELGAVDTIRADLGTGEFRGQYLRLSSDSPVPLSPQLAEVEVYESRTPDVVSVLADGREVPVTDRLDLPPGVRRLALRLRIPQEGMPPGVAFRWRLLGELDAWQESRLMSIDMACPVPGKSVFEAQALHSDGQWDATIYRLPIHTGRFFWKTPLFQWSAGIGIVLLAVGLGVSLTRRRAKRQLARLKMESALADERARIAQDLHDDLGANLTQIAYLADSLLAKPEPDRERADQIDKIRTTARDMTRALDEIVWAVEPGKDSLESLVVYLTGFAQEILANAGIACRFDLPDHLPPQPLTSGTRHQLFLACKEALHNIIRHSGATEVEIRLAIHPTECQLVIADNGRGFDPADPGARPGGGRGRTNLGERMAKIRGGCEWLHRHGGGTELRLNWKRNT